MNESVSLGKTPLKISRLGVGTWAWGDKTVWGYGKGYSDADLRRAFEKSIACGITFFDTAELYGFGKSEQLLGQFIRESKAAVLVGTKFFPFPWRLRRRTVLSALRRSLKRLNLASVELYQIHWPFHLLSIPSMMSILSEAVHEGLTKAVGISNYNADQMRRAADALAREKIPLASNQVEYSLLHRAPEQNGVLQVCRELGVSLIAYSPLAMGMLTGKYSARKLPSGFRGVRYRRANLDSLDALLSLLANIGEAHGGRTRAQVALNWLMSKGVIPIPGAKNVLQATENAGSLEWSLTIEETEALDTISSRLSV